MRPSRRQADELRAISLERGVVKYAEGSCFVKFGDTHVLATATLEDRLPPWLKGQARGWVTAEYGMLPRATSERTRREASSGKRVAARSRSNVLLGAACGRCLTYRPSGNGRLRSIAMSSRPMAEPERRRSPAHGSLCTIASAG